MKTFFSKVYIVLLLVVFAANANAQKNSLYIDSLKKILLTEREDTNKVNTLNALASQFNINLDSMNAATYANTALLLAKKTNFKKAMANAYSSLGLACMNGGNSTEALKFYNVALTIYKKINDKTSIANTYSFMAGLYYGLENLSEALQNSLSALKVWEELGDKSHIADSYQYTGAVYSALGNNSEALKFYFLALKIQKEKENKNRIAQTYLSIGECYTNEKQYAKATYYDSLGYVIYKGLSDKGFDWGIPFALNSIATNYDNEGDFDIVAGNKISGDKNYIKALKYYLLALEEWKKLGWKASYSEVISNIGYLYLKLNDIGKAKKYLKEGAQEEKDLNTMRGLMDNYLNLSIVDSIERNYEQAYNNYKTYIIYRDSIYNDEKTKKSVKVQMQYSFDKKEAIAKAEQEKKDADSRRIKNQQYFAIATLAVIVLAAIIIAFIQFRSNKQKKQANLLLQQQKQKVEITLSELKSTQAQLIQSEKMASLGELTAGIAHEIQNPLNFVNNFSEVNTELIDEAGQEIDKGNIGGVKTILNDIKENEQKINHHGKRADAIVKGMLQHSRISAGQKELTDINVLADEYLRLAYHGLKAKDKSFNAKFTTDLDKTIEKINIIPQDIGRVILNLLTNAFYVVNEKKKQVEQDLTGFKNLLGLEHYEPTVSVSTKKIANKVLISVKDNGNGIPQKILVKIFQPFFTSKPTGQGTGLGLSLSYDIIKAHGGEIKVETQEGKGSEFIIQLPFV
ncbi:MAG: ATP-binding protein [Ginsengibacter sp.]